MDNDIKTIDYQKLFAEGKRFLKTEFDYGRLTAMEKLIALLSTMAVVAVVGIFLILALYFISEAIVDVLTIALGKEWLANIVVAIVVLLLMALVVLMRRQLIIDPISRFITRLFLDDGKNSSIS